MSTLLDLSGRVAVVTGASQGIGAAVAERLAEAGAAVVVHYRGNEAGAEAVVDRITRSGGVAVAVGAELSDRAGVERLFSSAQQDLGRLDVLVNAAGAFPTGGLLDTPQTTWDTIFAGNVTSTLLCTQAAVPALRHAGAGAIVNIASLSAVTPGADHSAYNSAKAAVVMLTRSSAQELGRFGIRVNAVSPGLVWRPTLEQEWPAGLARWRERAPLAREGHPTEIADACLFLASSAARWITGHNLVVDGGMTAAALY